MPDNLTRAQRRYCMSRNKGKDTSLETRVRSELHNRGSRFRKHLKELPGKPDIVFTKARVAVFLDGDFWHGYEFSTWQHTVSPFWRAKISKTIERDKKNHCLLQDMGWTVIRLWEHDIERDLEASIQQVTSAVRQKATAQGRDGKLRHRRPYVVVPPEKYSVRRTDCDRYCEETTDSELGK